MIAHLRGLQGKLTTTTFDGFLADVRSVSVSGAEAVIDLRQVPFIDLFSMVGILYACEEIHELDGRTIRLELDIDNPACAFLPRTGFFEFLPPHVIQPHHVPPARLQWMEALRGSDKQFLELTRISSGPEIWQALARLRDILRHSFRYKQRDADNLTVAVSELCNNVIEHNPDGCAGLVAMQAFKPAPPAPRFLQFVVADRGLGIAATLRRNPRFRDTPTDQAAISASLQEGASERDDPYHGMGLPRLRAIVQAHQGGLHLRSGTGKVRIRADQDSWTEHAVAPLRGTQVAVTVPARV